MKIYTKTGDDGTTGLFSGERVLKSSLRVEAYGTVDELNSVLGIISTLELDEKIKEPVRKIQNLLFNLGSDLATPIHSKMSNKIERIKNEDIEFLENLIDEYVNELLIKFLNRLSDLLFVMARMANHLAGKDDVKWEK